MLPSEIQINVISKPCGKFQRVLTLRYPVINIQTQKYINLQTRPKILNNFTWVITAIRCTPSISWLYTGPISIASILAIVTPTFEVSFTFTVPITISFTDITWIVIGAALIPTVGVLRIATCWKVNVSLVLELSEWR